MNTIYREYQMARDGGCTAEQIAAEGWCGDMAAEFETCYARIDAEYRDVMRPDQFDGETMHEKERRVGP